MDEWSGRRWWLVAWLAVTALAAAVTINRLMNVTGMLTGTQGFPLLARDLLIEAAWSAMFAVGAGIIAFVPATWSATGTVGGSERIASRD